MITSNVTRLVLPCLLALVVALTLGAGLAVADISEPDSELEFESQATTGTITVENVVPADDEGDDIDDAYVIVTDQETDGQQFVRGVGELDAAGEDVSVELSSETESGTHEAYLLETSQLGADDDPDELLDTDVSQTDLDLLATDGDEPETAEIYYEDADALAESDSLFWTGQTLLVADEDPSDDAYELRRDNGSFVTEFTLSEEEPTQLIDPEEYELEGAYVVHPDDGPVDLSAGLVGDGVDEADASWEISDQSFDAEIESGTVTDRTDDLQLEFDSNRGYYDINVSAEELDGADLEGIFDDAFELTRHDDAVTLHEATNGDHELDITGVTGSFEFEFDVVDTDSVDTATIEVLDSSDVDRTVRSTTADRGEIATIRTSFEHADETALRVGDADEVGYEVGLTITAEDADSADLEVNTHTAGGSLGDPSYDERAAWSVDDDDVEIEIEYVDVGDGPSEGSVTDVTLDDHLGAGSYDLEIGGSWDLEDEDSPELVDPSDTATLTLEERSHPAGLETFTAPADDDLTELRSATTDADVTTNETVTVTETTSIADDDRLLVGIEDAGMTGLLADELESDEVVDGETLEDVGLSIALIQQEPPLNAEEAVWNSNSDAGNDLDVVMINDDGYDGEFLLVALEYEGDYAENVSAGEGYDLSVSLSEANPYVGDGTELSEPYEESVEIELREPTLELESDRFEASDYEDVEIAGRSNLAPGTEIEATAIKDDRFVLSGVGAGGDDPTVDSTGAFAASFDFSEYEDVSEFNVTVSNDDGDRSLEDSATGALVTAGHTTEATSSEIELEVDGPETIEEGESANFTANVTNAEPEPIDVAVGFDVGFSSWDRSLEVAANGSNETTFTIDSDHLDPGEQEWELSVDDTTESGTITLEGDDGEADDAPDDETDETTDVDDMPGFGLTVAIACVLGVALVLIGRHRSLPDGQDR